MSLLSALLTQDQVVSPKAIDEAISRQVISGGDFETSLLEGGAIGEDTLARYCAAVHGLPHATREDVAEADPVAIARLPRALAERHQMAALFIDAGRLIVAVAGPVSPAARIEVEAAVKLPLEARCVTTVRLAWALWRYQFPLPARFERLSARLSTMPPGPVPVDVLIPLTRPRDGSRPSSPALDALAAFDAALSEEDAGGSSHPPPSEPAPPPGLRRSAPEFARARVVEVRPSNPMAVNLPTTTPPFGTLAATPSHPPAPPRVSTPPPEATRPSAPPGEPLRAPSPTADTVRVSVPLIETVRVSAPAEPPRSSSPPDAPRPSVARASPPPPLTFPSEPPPATRPAILPGPSHAARPVPSQRANEASAPAPPAAEAPAAPSSAATTAPSSLPPTPLLPSAPALPAG